MTSPPPSVWDGLDAKTRAHLDAVFLEELRVLASPGVTDEATVRAYLEYRHERPHGQMTTYEEGQVRRMLARHRDPATAPDPVAAEEHTGRLERFGAERLGLTNIGTFGTVMFVLVYLVLLATLLILIVP